MCITFLAGMGFGLIYLPSIVIVQYYFDKKRAFATGVSTCGSGIGAIIFAPFSKFLIDQYAWKGAQWIMAAIVLNGMVLGCVYRPLTFRELERIRRRWQRKQERLDRRKLEVEIENSKLNLQSSHMNGNIAHIKDMKGNLNVRAKSVDTLVDSNDNKINRIGHLKSDSDAFPVGSVSSFRSNASCGNNVRRRFRTQSEAASNIGASWHSLGIITRSMNNLDADNRDCDETSITDNSEETNHEDDTICDIFKDIFRGIKETMDFSMLKSPVFLIYGLSCIFSMAGTYDKSVLNFAFMGLLPDMLYCVLRMRRECRERFPRLRLQRKLLVSDPGMHHGTCVTHAPWCMLGSLPRGAGENVPGIPGASATHNFTYLARCLLIRILYKTMW